MRTIVPKAHCTAHAGLRGDYVARASRPTSSVNVSAADLARWADVVKQAGAGID